MAVERFLDELSRSIDRLPEEERAPMLDRLRLAKEFMGTVDPLEFFREWRAPEEIYRPLFPQALER
jgi:hypothetical protein